MSLIEKAANVAVIAAACVVIGAVAHDRIKVTNARAAVNFKTNYLRKHLPLPVALGTNATLVLFYSKNCHYCGESAPFYRRLVALKSRSSGGLVLVAEFPQLRETYTDGLAYFASKELTPDAVVPASFPDLGIVATPTLALVDKTGVVKAIWTDKLSKEKEDEVMSEIGSLCSSCSAGS